MKEAKFFNEYKWESVVSFLGMLKEKGITLKEVFDIIWEIKK